MEDLEKKAQALVAFYKQSETGKELQPTLSEEYLRTLTKWIAVLSEHYRIPVTSLSLTAYIVALSDLTPSELNLAFQESIKRCPEYMPVAGKVRECLQEARLEGATVRRMQGVTDEKPWCPRCGNSGWWKPEEKDHAVPCQH